MNTQPVTEPIAISAVVDLPWPLVPLGQVVQQRKEFFTISDDQLYKRPRVQVRVQGLVLRDEILGSTIRTKRQQRCKTNDFLVAEIDAKVGGFGVVPPELDGAIVSSHYYLFELDTAQLNPEFLHYAVQMPGFLAQIEARGSTNYASIRAAQVLTYQIPLPPLREQQRSRLHYEQLRRHAPPTQTCWSRPAS